MAASKNRTNEEWRLIITDQRKSGQPQAKWCAENGINLHTMRDRASRLNRLEKETADRPRQTEAAKGKWVDVTPEKHPEKDNATDAISIKCGEYEITVRAGFDANQLTELLWAVRRSCC